MLCSVLHLAETRNISLEKYRRDEKQTSEFCEVHSPVT